MSDHGDHSCHTGAIQHHFDKSKCRTAHRISSGTRRGGTENGNGLLLIATTETSLNAQPFTQSARCAHCILLSIMVKAHKRVVMSALAISASRKIKPVWYRMFIILTWLRPDLYASHHTMPLTTSPIVVHVKGHIHEKNRRTSYLFTVLY